MNNMKAIFIKQLTYLVKMPALIIQGAMFLAIAAAFIFLVPHDEPHECDVCVPAYVCAPCVEREENRFQMPIPSQIGVFTVIFIGLALVGSASALVHEDRTTTNLRFMAMAGVKPAQYVLPTVLSIMIVVAGVLVFYALVGGYTGAYMLRFMAITVSGGLVSALLGITLGLSKLQILTMPLSMLLGIGPTFAAFNESLANAFSFTFIQQVNIALADLSEDLTSNLTVIAVNGAVVLLAFILLHRKNRFNL